MPISRRDLIRVGSLGLLGINLTDYLRGAGASKLTGKAQACILLWLEGGPSHVDTFDPKPTSAFRPISTNVAGIQISELLPQLAQRMDKLAVVRSMRTKASDHLQATHYAITGHEPNPGMSFPSLGSIVAKETQARNGIPRYVLMPQWVKDRQYEDYFRGAFLGSDYDPMCVTDPSKDGFQVPDLTLPKSASGSVVHSRQELLSVVDRRYRELYDKAEHANMDALTGRACEILLNPAVRSAFDLSGEPGKLRDQYGRDSVGQSALLARRLIEAGSRFVTVAGYHGGAWDTHVGSDASHRDKLCPSFDRTLSALLDDLAQRGLLETTVVLAMGEFGRTPFMNPARGRDHYPACWSLALGGGGIKTGQVVGTSDENGAVVTSRPVCMGDIYATVYKALGLDWTKEYMSPIGRPIKIANSLDDMNAVPIDELL
jgi:hypothetical protein